MALAVVFQVPKDIIIDTVILKSCSFRESWVTLRSGFAGAVGEYCPKAVLKRVFVMIVLFRPTHSGADQYLHCETKDMSMINVPPAEFEVIGWLQST